MNNPKVLKLTVFMAAAALSLTLYTKLAQTSKPLSPQNNREKPILNDGGPEQSTHPLAINSMREKEYPGSEILIEQELSPGTGFSRYIVSYKSDGLKIFALLTVPEGDVPTGGWPAIVFNHGYIPPEQYSTTQKYENYVAGFAKNGYVVLKPDFRGHGNSDGKPEGAYFSPAYTTDALNALSSLKRLSYVNNDKIGMWGHSMGGNITLRSMVISSDIKVGVIWAGVVGSYEDIFYNWRRDKKWTPSNREQNTNRPSRQDFVELYGEPKDNPVFWNELSPTSYITDISGPIQLHHGTNDGSVPIEFSQKLSNLMSQNNKSVEFHAYEGADHNLSGNAFGLAMQRSVDFFDKYLK